MAELRPQRELGDGGDAIPEVPDESDVPGPRHVLREDMEQHAVLIQFHVVTAAHLA